MREPISNVIGRRYTAKGHRERLKSVKYFFLVHFVLLFTTLTAEKSYAVYKITNILGSYSYWNDFKNTLKDDYSELDYSFGFSDNKYLMRGLVWGQIDFPKSLTYYDRLHALPSLFSVFDTRGEFIKRIFLFEGENSVLASIDLYKCDGDFCLKNFIPKVPYGFDESIGLDLDTQQENYFSHSVRSFQLLVLKTLEDDNLGIKDSIRNKQSGLLISVPEKIFSLDHKEKFIRIDDVNILDVESSSHGVIMPE